MKKRSLIREIIILLSNNLDLRDDWMGMVREIHLIQMKELGIDSKDYFYTLFYTEKLTNPQTIGRLWRLVQNERESLRGKLWKERQKQGGQISQEFAQGINQQQKLDL